MRVVAHGDGWLDDVGGEGCGLRAGWTSGPWPLDGRGRWSYGWLPWLRLPCPLRQLRLGLLGLLVTSATVVADLPCVPWYSLSTGCRLGTLFLCLTCIARVVNGSSCLRPVLTAPWLKVSL